MHDGGALLCGIDFYRFVLHRKAYFLPRRGVGNIRIKGDVGTAVVIDFRRHGDAGCAVIFQIKMRVWHGNQVHTAVQPAEKGEIRRLRVNLFIFAVVAKHGEF